MNKNNWPLVQAKITNRSTLLDPSPNGGRKRTKETRKITASSNASRIALSGKRPQRERTTRELALDYYQRLLHQCRKAWNKQIKAIKNTEKLKYNSKKKKKKQTHEGENELISDAARTGTVKEDGLDKVYEELKDLSVDMIVDEAMRRLGILSLNPLDKEGGIGNKETTSIEDDVASPSSRERPPPSECGDQLNQPLHISRSEKPSHAVSPLQRTWMETILSHTRLAKLSDEWNAEITKYRQWYIDQQLKEHHREAPVSSDSLSRRRKRQRKISDQEKEDNDRDFLTHGQSLFYQLGRNDDENNDTSPDEGILVSSSRKKPNRPGQRARRNRRVMEEQQHRELPRHVKDTDRRKVEERPTTKRNKKHAAPLSRNQTKSIMETSKEDTTMHPSWEARKAKPKGIVPFQGTRITFADDE